MWLMVGVWILNSESGGMLRVLHRIGWMECVCCAHAYVCIQKLDAVLGRPNRVKLWLSALAANESKHRLRESISRASEATNDCSQLFANTPSRCGIKQWKLFVKSVDPRWPLNLDCGGSCGVFCGIRFIHNMCGLYQPNWLLVAVLAMTFTTCDKKLIELEVVLF